jgi:hypothetical protein
MLRLASVVSALTLVGCVAGATPDDADLTLAAGDTAAWNTAATLHVGEATLGGAGAHARTVYPVWLAGSAAAPLTLDVVATAEDGHDVRISVLGPIRGDGTRPVLGAGGYAQPRGNVELSIEADAVGEYLIVAGSYELATATEFTLRTYCWDCDAARTDALAFPKSGALTGTGDRIVHAELGAAVRSRDDVSIELWVSPPLHREQAHFVATVPAVDGAVDLPVPASATEGDDLVLVVRESSGAMLDAGVAARFAPEARAFVRTDALVYNAGGAITASGVTPMFEGRAQLVLHSDARGIVLAEAAVAAERPGQIGNGLSAFDAAFPRAAFGRGERLSIGTYNGNGDYRAIACFAAGGAANSCTP